MNTKTSEALGRMFKHGLKLYVYPMIDEKTGKITTATQVEVAPNLRSLYQYLIDNRHIEEIGDYQKDFLRIYPPAVLDWRLSERFSTNLSTGGPGQTKGRRRKLGRDGAAGSGPDHQRA